MFLFPDRRTEREQLEFVSSLHREIGSREERATALSSELERCEAELRDKDRALTQATSRVRELESGEYGLPEAVAEIKELRRQVRLRENRSIEGLRESNIRL